ncbi:macro domain-containing protein (plasmid) [Streptosporangium sp. NBC_01495]|uniref:macro domain-containing protein n=1 Tax=Streptosporangium sp. NBC_01495 TaxID=2903899 RepID=UPI002E36CCE1|nr:macro domain-containing protein [Streptosporangium sp. NBC_01495]
MITVIAGDLLADTAQALVNPVNTVGIIGKGLALQFRRTYPEAYQSYRQACDRGEIQPGILHIAPIANGRIIVHFPTKRHWRDVSRLADIEVGLSALALLIKERQIATIAIPALGAGLGGLRWPEVEALIYLYLEPLKDLDVRLYPPRA